MMTGLAWMLPPLAMCLVLTGVHGYLGLHVLSRKVIFVDLALAQIAALGSAYALLLGYDPSEPGQGVVVYLFSLGFTFVGAAVFALTRMRHDKVPQEALIGVAYATASALALLLMARSAGEGEHIKEMLVGNILLVTWPEVGKTAAIYLLIGVFHVVFRRPFIEISTDPEAAQARGRRVRLWDFLFYASFGFVITSSVAVAGVLLVFTFLIVPAVIAFLFYAGIGPRVALAWVVGAVGSAAGMLVSYYGDLPTGPSVVACFGGLLVLAGLLHFVRGADRRGVAVAKVIGGLAVASALIVLSLQARRAPEVPLPPQADLKAFVDALQSPDEGVQLDAVRRLAEMREPRVVAPLVEALRGAKTDRLAEHIVKALGGFGDAARPAVSALEEVSRRSEDPFLRFEAARVLLHLGEPAGFSALAVILSEDPPLLLEQQVGQVIKEVSGQDFGIGQGGDDQARVQARQSFERWLLDRGDGSGQRQDLRRFQ